MTRTPSDPTLVRLGEAILLRRRRLKWSQEALALRAGINRTHLSRVERGEHNLSLLNVVAIAGALGTTAGELLTEASV